MRSAYYSRNDSYSRSLNAELAEAANRYPRSRAASFLGLSLKAFDAGCQAANYVSREWHHVSKYANEVNYYDCEELADSEEFWQGAAAAYKSAKKQAEILARFHQRLQAERQARIEAFRQRLIKQRDCSRPVQRHRACDKWSERCRAAGVSTNIPIGDVAALRQATAERQARLAAKSAWAVELRDYLNRHATQINNREYMLCGKKVAIHDGFVNVYGVEKGVNLPATEALVIVQQLHLSSSPAI